MCESLTFLPLASGTISGECRRVSGVLGALRSLVLAIALAPLLLALPAVAGPLTPPFTQAPPVGADTSAEILLNFDGASVHALFDPSQGPYDGDDDTLYGVQNSSTASVLYSITLYAYSIDSSGNRFARPLFDFDGDGQATYTGHYYGPTGYEGPKTSFVVQTPYVGTIVFQNGIPPGGSAWFSLEVALPQNAVIGAVFNQGPLVVPPGKAPGYPAWWYQWGVIDPNASPVDFSLFNQGQLKTFATAAYDEFQNLPGGPGAAVTALVKAWFQLDGQGNFLYDFSGNRVPKVTAQTADFEPVALGQLKTVASVLYDRLIATGHAQQYPWTGQARDFEVTNVGQAKQVFAFTIVPELLAPVITPNGGTVSDTDPITLSGVPPDADIYYTTNGAVPDLSSPRYTGPFTLSETCTLQARALGQGYTPSAVSSAVFLVMRHLAAPQFSPNGGSFWPTVSVTISDTDSGEIRYTLDGSDPTANSPLYTGPFPLSSTTTVTARCFDPDGVNLTSNPTSATFTAQLTAPSISPGSGAYQSPLQITLSSPDPGVNIRYTTDGADPSSTSGVVYTGPFIVSGPSVTVKAAANTGSTVSPVATATYTLSSVSATVTSAITGVNLTSTEISSASDWVHWGDTSATSIVRRAGGSGISNYILVGTGIANAYTGDLRLMSWSDGTPTTSSTSNSKGVQVAGSVGNGFTFLVPAGLSARTVLVYVGGQRSGGTLKAQLTGSSTPDYVDVETTVNNASYGRTYSITYTANTAGQSLRITWTMSSIQAGQSGSVRIQGAALP